MQSSLDCLILLGVTSSDFENAIEKSKHSRDIIKFSLQSCLNTLLSANWEPML